MINIQMKQNVLELCFSAAGSRVSILSNGELHIRDIRDDDKYTMYRCIARNVLTLEENTSEFAYVKMHGKGDNWRIRLRCTSKCTVRGITSEFAYVKMHGKEDNWRIRLRQNAR